MMEIEKEQYVINLTENNRPISLDISYLRNNKPKPILVYAHGFKGFKDWGQFGLIADFFAQHDYVFVKLNFSMNGTSPDHLIDFVDLEGFGQNTISQELDDLESTIKYIKKLVNPDFDATRIALLGHSRGGATCHIKALENDSIKSVTSWASVLDLKDRYATRDLEQWKNEGIKYVFNGRTKQNMPLNFSLAEDILDNQERFELQNRISRTTKPTLLIHGDCDSVVEPQELNLVSNSNTLVSKIVINNADHTFGGRHPYEDIILPEPTLAACKKTHEFFQKNL